MIKGVRVAWSKIAPTFRILQCSFTKLCNPRSMPEYFVCFVKFVCLEPADNNATVASGHNIILERHQGGENLIISGMCRNEKFCKIFPF